MPVPAYDLPSEPSVFAPDYAPEEIAAIAEKPRVKAGLPKQPSGEVANGNRRPRAKTSTTANRNKKTTATKAAAR